MKKLLFFAVSAILAGASYCSSVSEKIVAKVARIVHTVLIALIVHTIRVDKNFTS